MTHPRVRLPTLIACHLLLTAAVSGLFAWQFGHNVRAVAAHVLLVGEWDLALAGVACAAYGFAGTGWPRLLWRGLLVLTGSLQVYLYTLNLASNVSWNRNMTAHLVTAFAPTVWSGKEPFPVGPVGMSVFVCGTILVMAVAVRWQGRALDQSLVSWVPVRRDVPGRQRHRRRGMVVATVVAVVAVTLSRVTTAWAVADRDNLYWKQELISSFFRPDAFAFEPTARRHAVAEHDTALRASYPRPATPPHTNVVLVIVDSLRADRMQIYGYPRPTTPFLSELVATGRMRQIANAFSTCSESLCGITSTLTGREFRDISARTFQLQDVLRDVGYRTWFVLSGNHSAWNGLPQFYRADEGTFFDGSQTARYTMDDDRLVLEGFEGVPPASPDRPAFFYVHLMSPHYLGVQFTESHVFTASDDRVSPGLEPYKILDRLNKPDRYDDKVRQADGILRQLFAVLAEKRYLDDAIVVVTGDHGEGLGERHWAHGWHLYNEDIRIPMLFYDTSGTSYPDLSFATQIDIAPTILTRLGLPVPDSWQGQSLLAPSRTRFTYHQTYFLPNRFAVVHRRGEALLKFISTPQYGKEELYDLIADAGETHNLVTEQAETASLLRERLAAYRGDED